MNPLQIRVFWHIIRKFTVLYALHYNNVLEWFQLRKYHLRLSLLHFPLFLVATLQNERWISHSNSTSIQITKMLYKCLLLLLSRTDLMLYNIIYLFIRFIIRLLDVPESCTNAESLYISKIRFLKASWSWTPLARN